MQGTAKPLLGKRILVTRPTGKAEGLSRKLQNLGAIAIEIPTIEIQPLSDTYQIDDSIRNLSKYDWIVFTSVYGVDIFFQRMASLKTPFSALIPVRIAAIGSATSAALERIGRKPDYVPSEFLSERIVTGLDDLHGKRILLPRANIASKRLPLLLRNKGAVVEEVTAYRTVSPSELSNEKLKEIIRAGVDVVTFTSPSTVHNFANALGHDVGKFLSNVKVACIGPVTFEAARETGINVNIIANPHTTDALVEAIVNDFRTL